MDALANPEAGHLEIIELLPDYAVGRLNDTELDHVARHLEECPTCRHALRQILHMVGILSNQPVPSPSTREELLARARGEESPIAPDWALGPPAPPPPVPMTTDGPERPSPIRPWWKTQVPIALTMAAALLLLAFGISALRPTVPVADDAIIASIIANAPLYPLTDGDLTPPASGVLFADDGASRAVLLAEGLPPLPADQRYQVWLFTDDGERASGGLFTPDASGRAEILIETPQPLRAYAAVAVSAEPAGGSQTPTSPLALGGWID